MTEMSTSENEELVSRVYTQALADRDDGKALGAAELMVYHVEMLSQEVNSGASFEQYFRWASIDEISQAAGRLESLGLPEVAEIARRAIDVAFPDGIPATDDEKSEQVDWTEEQEEALGALAEEFEAFNGRIINLLAEYYRKTQRGA
jgi:hypothetical protein